jgi:predicted NUDIX family NTP pyrophosphohydrolase
MSEAIQVMARLSAGLLVYRINGNRPEVFLVHPGGPLWAHRDENAWSLPKGEYGDEEAPLEAAMREFREETGFEVPAGRPMALKSIKQPSGKIVSAWAVDRGGWFDLPQARRKIVRGQTGFLDELEALIA